jgi:hypothetical protein
MKAGPGRAIKPTICDGRHIGEVATCDTGHIKSPKWGRLMITQAVTLQHDATIGRRLRNIGIALTVATTAFGFYWFFYGGSVYTAVLLLFFLALSLLGRLGRFLLFRGKQYLARSEPAESLHDPRPPVVLLRPFRLDAATPVLVPQPFQNQTQGPHRDPSKSDFFEYAAGVPKLYVRKGRTFEHSREDFTTSEEYIAKSLSSIGPLVALGRPGEAFPPPGAHRFHETDQTWKDRVVDLLRKARIVILFPGTSEALNWETMTAFRELKPEQLVILDVGTDTPRQYEVLTRICKETTGKWLPHPRNLGLAKENCITFDEGWVARIRQLDKPRWRSSAARLHNALEPVFRANGIKWSPLPLSMGEVPWLLAMASPFAIFLYSFDWSMMGVTSLLAMASFFAIFLYFFCLPLVLTKPNDVAPLALAYKLLSWFPPPVAGGYPTRAASRRRETPPNPSESILPSTDETIDILVSRYRQQCPPQPANPPAQMT